MREVAREIRRPAQSMDAPYSHEVPGTKSRGKL